MVKNNIITGKTKEVQHKLKSKRVIINKYTKIKICDNDIIIYNCHLEE